MEFISKHDNNLLANNFGIKKTCKLLAKKYCCPTFKHNFEAYVKGCDVCLVSKAVRYKPYGDFQSLPVSTHQWNNILMAFVTGLPISTNWKKDNYDSILVIINRLIMMIYYNPVKITINAPGLAKIIIDLIIRHYGLPDSIMTDRGFLIISKFWSLLCSFFDIKRKLSIAFYSQIDTPTEPQNSTIETYFRVFVNFKQNN